MVARTTTIRVRLLRRTLTALTLAAACSRERAPGSDRASPPPPPTPAAFVEGERLFGANCASCHGRYARGTDQGPPLVDAIYKPSHHADAAFYFAAARGAVQHHWHFGNMPAQPQVSRDAMTQVIGYVRWLQREAGIE